MKQRLKVRRPVRWFVALLSLTMTALASAAGHDQPSPVTMGTALTLRDAINLALSNNPALRAAGARVEAAQGSAVQTRAWPNPDLELAAEEWPLGRNRGGFSEAEQLVGVAQTIPFPGKKHLDAQTGAQRVRVTEAQARLRRAELVRDVKIAFWRVLAAQGLIAVEQDLVKVAEDSATAARKRVEAGAAPDQEQLRAEIPLEQARSELAGFEQELELSRQALFTLAARPDLQGTPLAGRLAESADPWLLDRTPGEWLGEQPAVQAVRQARKQAEFEHRRARLEPYPDVRVGLAGGRQSETGDSILAVRLSVPLPIFDRSKGRKQEAQASVRVAEAEQASIEQELLREWAGATRRVRTAAQQAAAYRERILPKANEALRLVQSGFEHGKFGFIDLLDTLRTAAEARLAYQQKLLELNIAHAQLEALAAPGATNPHETLP